MTASDHAPRKYIATRAPATRFVLGVPVDIVDEAGVLDFCRERLASREPAQICTVNAEFVMRARGDPAFRAVLEQAALRTPDSAGVVWALRRQGVEIGRRVGGSDLIWSLSELAATESRRLFLLGAEEGVAAEAGRRLVQAYPGLILAGAHAGSPDPAQDAAIVDLIRRANADIICVAFGAPAQEEWIARNLQRTGALIAIGVGGSIDYVAGTARRAPRWMRDHGLDWLWRLVNQPWRWRRMLTLPVFALLVLRGNGQVPSERIEK